MSGFSSNEKFVEKEDRFTRAAWQSWDDDMKWFSEEQDSTRSRWRPVAYFREDSNGAPDSIKAENLLISG
jgi:hypothetical protein